MEIGLEDEIIDDTHHPKTRGRGNVIESSLSGIIKIVRLLRPNIF